MATEQLYSNYWSWTILSNSLIQSHHVTELLMSQLLIQSHSMSSWLFPFISLYNRHTLTYLIHIKCVITLNVWKIFIKCVILTKIWCHSISSQFSSSVLDHNIFLVEWTYSTLSDYVISINAWKYVENSLFDKICFST